MITSSFNEKSHSIVYLYFTHQELFHQHFTGVTLTHPSPNWFLCHMGRLQCKSPSNHILPSETVHKSQSLVSLQLHWAISSSISFRQTMAISLGTLCWNRVPLASFEKYSCLAPPPSMYNVEVGFWNWRLIFNIVWGGWEGGTDSHKTCKRLLNTVEIAFSDFSLKYYQVSQGLMAIIVYRPVWKRKRLSLRM